MKHGEACDLCYLEILIRLIDFKIVEGGFTKKV